MSKGPGTVEKRIAALFIATEDRALSVGEIADHAFELAGEPATRAQRLSATRAAHRLLRRIREADEQSSQLFKEAHRNTEAALGRKQRHGLGQPDTEYQDRFHADPAHIRGQKLMDFTHEFRLYEWARYAIEGRGDHRTYRHESTDYWRATIGEDGALYFHAPDVPVRVWAVSVQPAGVIWADAEVVSITETRVNIRYGGDRGWLDRRGLWENWANYRGVKFASSRTGRVAQMFDQMWQDRYGYTAGGAAPPSMQMPLAEAIALLQVPVDYTKEDVIAAFRREAKKAHPDLGGTAEQFRRLVEARDRLLAALGTSAPAPKMPTFAPIGARVVYRRVRLGSQRRLGPASRRLFRA